MSGNETLAIDPAKLPAWVAWLAQDGDGTWWGYEAEPHPHHCGWYENETGRSICIIRCDPNPDWASSLRPVRPVGH